MQPGRRQLGRAGRDVTAVLRGQGLRDRSRGRAHPVDLPRVPHDAARRVRRVPPRARAGRPHVRERRQPRSQAVPLARRRRHHHPAGRARDAAAGRGRVGEGEGCRGVLRVRLVHEGVQPGAARPQRAGGHRVEGPLRPGHPHARTAPKLGLPHESDISKEEFLASTLDVWEIRPERARAGQPPGAVPGRAARAVRPPVHLRRRRRPRPVPGLGVDGGGRGAHRPPLRGLRPRPRVRGDRRSAHRRGRRALPPPAPPRPSPPTDGRGRSGRTIQPCPGPALSP